MAEVITIPLTPDQCMKAQTALSSVGKVYPSDGDNAGHVCTQQIDFSYTYDGKLLTMTITGKHGLARFASVDAIKAHIEALLA